MNKIKINQFDNLFFRSLKQMSNDSYGTKKMNVDSIPIEYSMNSHGYRCNEFNNQEILILGCSQTEGHGMPLEYTWPYLLSKKMNKDYINLAKGGDGVQGQVTKAFQFFEEFYNPKYIFAIFPLTRLEVPLINIRSKSQKNILSLKDERRIIKSLFNNNHLEKFSKSPHIIENVIPEEFAIFYNILFFKMLSQYCKTNDIRLIWSYYLDTSINVPPIETMIDGYFESIYLNDEPEYCHLEFSNNSLFHHASDYDHWPPGHWGIHKHLHIAESIYNML